MISKMEIGFLEKFFESSPGYVLDFSNGTFSTFVCDSVGIDIYSDEYKIKVKKKFNSSSKMNILRYILRYEDPELTIKLLKDLIEYYELNSSYEYDFDEKSLFKAKNILNKYVADFPQINENSSDERIIDLINEINKSISEGKPIFTLDRLHTLVHNKLREICVLHNIEFDKKDRMDQLLKKYLKFLEDNYSFNSDMSKTILKQSISLLSEFNNVRNNKSYAHDNPILNFDESLLIYKSIVNTLEFISSIDDDFTID